MSHQNTLYETQIQRERGVDFGIREKDTTVEALLNNKIFAAAIKLCLGLDGDYDRDISLGDAYSQFKHTLKDWLLEKKPGKPTDSEAIWVAFSIEELLQNSHKEKDKKVWADFSEVLFNITLYEMLRCILEAMCGDSPRYSKDTIDDKDVMDDEPDEDTDGVQELYLWPTLLIVLPRIWDSILTELAISLDVPDGETWTKRIRILNSPRFNQKNDSWYRKKIIHDLMIESGITDKQGTAFAQDLVDLVQKALENNPLFEIRQVDLDKATMQDKIKKAPYCLTATPALLERIQKFSEQKHIVPQFSPLLIEPRQWDTQDRGILSGGYYCNNLPLYKFKFSARNRFIKSFENILEKDDSYQNVFAAINALQNTPWRINKRVRQVLTDLMLIAEIKPKVHPVSDSIRKREDLISKILIDVKTCRSKKSKLPIARFKQPGWRFLGRNYENNPDLPRGLMNQSLIEDLAIHDRFYFAYQADTRGRLYAKASWLSPYGEDLSKSLLEFADSRPLTAAGVRPLAIHGSQLVKTTIILEELGIPKERTSLTLDERVAWIKLREAEIRATAENPVEHIWWMEAAKKPFQFLAFCFAWADYLMEGDEAPCSLPVHQDGTCNGLQHIAAMTRDRALAEATNVLPGSPRDIYMELAEAVKSNIKSDTSDTQGIRFLQQHLDLLDRDLAKKVVMVIPYGSGKNGIIRTIKNALNENAKFKEAWTAFSDKDKEDQKKAYTVLSTIAEQIAQKMIEAMQEKYPVIQQFKECLKKSIDPILKRNIPVLWVAPSGFCAIQRNFEIKKTEVARSRFGNKKHRLTYDLVTDTVHVRDQKKGILPNFIHSFDSAHLIKTINLAYARGLRYFSVVHDSYATHPADAPVLAQCIRQAFIDIYGGDIPPLQHFIDWCEALSSVSDQSSQVYLESFLKTEITVLNMVSDWHKDSLCVPCDKPFERPKYPDSSGFEIESVAESEYFFS